MVSLEDLIKKEEGTQDKKEEKKTSSSGSGFLDKVWNTPTGTRPIAEYNKHALNWDKTPSTGKIIRGLEGMMGTLDKAVIDFGVGICQKIAELFSSGEKKE